MTLDDVNGLDRRAFTDALGWIFEHSPWVAERAWPRRPFASLLALHAAMTGALRAAARDEQLELLRAHPELGARAAMSAASSAEQSGAGLADLSPEEHQRLRDANARYRERFQFPFLYAVKDGTKRDILRNLEQRLEAQPDAEFEIALEQVERIAWFRLRDSIEDP